MKKNKGLYAGILISFTVHAALGFVAFYFLQIPSEPIKIHKKISVSLTKKQLYKKTIKKQPSQKKNKKKTRKEPEIIKKQTTSASERKKIVKKKQVKKRKVVKKQLKVSSKQKKRAQKNEKKQEHKTEKIQGFKIKLSGGTNGLGFKNDNNGSALGNAQAAGHGKKSKTGRPAESKEKKVTGSGLNETGPATESLTHVKKMPRVLKNVHIKYPEELKSLEIQGRVKLLLWINKKGRVIKARLIKGLHPKMDKLALIASKKLIFTPALVDGKPVPVKITYSFVFVLD